MFKHKKNVFFKNLKSVLTSWLQKICVTFMYTCTETHNLSHTSSSSDSVPCFHYILSSSQSNFFKNINCILPMSCSPWLPALLRIKSESFSMNFRGLVWFGSIYIFSHVVPPNPFAHDLQPLWFPSCFSANLVSVSGPFVGLKFLFVCCFFWLAPPHFS